MTIKKIKGRKMYRALGQQYLFSTVCATVILLAAMFFAGCTSEGASRLPGGDAVEGTVNILCTTFPLYDWAKQITSGQEEYISVSLLTGQGIDLHNYQPTAEDIIRITQADVVVYVGGESDRWMKDVIAAVPAERREKQIYLNLMEQMRDVLYEEEVTEGMTDTEHEGKITEGMTDTENEEGDEAGDVSDEERNRESDERGVTGEIEYDEHIWLSLRNAGQCVRLMERSIQEAVEGIADMGNPSLEDFPKEVISEDISNNASGYQEELEALDREYAAMAEEAPLHVLVFGDRFPFLYLVKDYGWEYYAAFPGCSAESEASFETVIFLADQLEKYDLPAVLVIENGNQQMAQTILENAGGKDRQILVLNSMQSVTSDEISRNVSYLSIMQENLKTLRTVLGLTDNG